jgi:membrane protease YdiL (CAAX protease family)
MTCQHIQPTLTTCILYAFSLVVAFVSNLYLLIPKEISQLPRSNVRQIKWRIFSIIVTFSVALASYPSLFYLCDEDEDEGHLSLSFNTMITSQVQNTTLVPLIHVIVLYFGSFITSLLQLKVSFTCSSSFNTVHRNSAIYPENQTTTLPSFILHQMIEITRHPFLNPWKAGRDLFVAPLAEESIFRVCMISPFLYSEQIGVLRICWMTPLFFCVAHMHHAVTKLKSGEKWQIVLLGTVFQMTYTTLFGAYASYCFIKLGSLIDIVLVHSFCNFMGLPNVALFSFDHNQMKMSGRDHVDLAKIVTFFKGVSCFAYILGIYGFAMGFRPSMGLFPSRDWSIAQVQ